MSGSPRHSREPSKQPRKQMSQRCLALSSAWDNHFDPPTDLKTRRQESSTSSAPSARRSSPSPFPPNASPSPKPFDRVTTKRSSARSVRPNEGRFKSVRRSIFTDSISGSLRCLTPQAPSASRPGKPITAPANSREPASRVWSISRTQEGLKATCGRCKRSFTRDSTSCITSPFVRPATIRIDGRKHQRHHQWPTTSKARRSAGTFIHPSSGWKSKISSTTKKKSSPSPKFAYFR